MEKNQKKQKMILGKFESVRARGKNVWHLVKQQIPNKTCSCKMKHL